MALKRKVTKLEEVPEQYHSEYVEAKDGSGFELALESDGDDEVSKLQRIVEAEKDQRRKAVKELQEFQAKTKETESERIRTEQEKLDKIEEEKLLSERKYKEVAELQFKRAKEALEAQIVELNTHLKAEREKYNKLDQSFISTIVDRQIEQELIDADAKPHGVKHAVAILRKHWSLDEDRKTPVKRDGDRILSGIADPTKPLTIREDILDWKKNDPFAPEFFLPSNGSGATGSSHTKNGAVVLSRSDARDVNKYSAAKAQAEKSGVPLQVSD